MAGQRDPRDTPAMRQFQAIKAKHPDCVLFFRMGDFYEMFDDDAVALSKALGLTLTQRSAGIPMAGVPYHQLTTYLQRAIDAGFRVAVVDQVQDPKEAKGVVERRVTSVVTPGTLVDEALVSDETAARIAAIAFTDAGDTSPAAACVVDLSTGESTVFNAPAAGIADALARHSVTEILYCETADAKVPPRVQAVLTTLNASGTPRASWHFRPAEALEAIRKQFAIATLAGFGLADDAPEAIPLGVVIRYLRETQTSDDESDPYATSATLAHLRPPRTDDAAGRCVIDAVSLRALEVERTIRDGELEGSLAGVFLRGKATCRTAMGKRLLRDWLRSPLGEIEPIRERHARVSALAHDRTLADALATALDPVQDIARIAGRLALARATPRDLVALGRSLASADTLQDTLQGAPSFAPMHEHLGTLTDSLAPLAERITTSCVEDPPAHLREGGLIADGIDPDLDEARTLQFDAGAWLAQYQGELIETHELPSLKVGYNKVFGYYIELPAAQAKRAPDTFTRKQTLKNAERYITPELKEFEDKVQSAEARAIEREQKLFEQLCDTAREHLSAIQAFADIAAQLDVLLCFANKAIARRWVQPEMTEDRILEIHAGRHPVLDESLEGNFVANDTALATIDSDTNESAARLALITGPNMAGKSTYIRQTALIVLLAHAGSFVPAEIATLGITDRIFTRVGADDALHQGQSTFMVEMTETANILNSATDRSLVILDEIGRGTSTLDGLSLAWAIAEHLIDTSCRTLFATHYHELTELETRLPGKARNLRVLVREWQEQITFLHRIEPGRTDRSYGVQVAQLAGVPRPVVVRAKEILETLSVQEARFDAGSVAPSPPTPNAQLPLFTEYLPHPALDRLREIKLESLSPMQAFDLLRELSAAAADQRQDA